MQIFNDGSEEEILFEYAVVRQGVVITICEEQSDALIVAQAGDLIMRISGIVEQKLTTIPSGKYFKTVERNRQLKVNSKE